MLLNPASLGDEPLWFCLRTAPKREHLAAGTLRAITGLEVFAPPIRFRRDTRRGPVWFVEGLFPGYLFARFSYCTQNRLVRHAHGVTGILAFGETIAVLEEPVIEQLRRLTPTDDTLTVEPAVVAGGEVRVVTGPLRGLHAVVTRLFPAKQRVKILIEFLGSYQEAETGIEGVLPTGNPRSTLKC